MTAAMVRDRSDGAGPSPAADARMAGDLEVPRPLRLLLTAGWNLSESVGLWFFSVLRRLGMRLRFAPA